MVAARERSSFIETNRDRGGHGLGDTLKTSSSIGPIAHSPLGVAEAASRDRFTIGRGWSDISRSSAAVRPLGRTNSRFLR